MTLRAGDDDMEPVIRETAVKGIITKTDIPVCDYAVNPYIGCTHGCKYCYAGKIRLLRTALPEWSRMPRA